MKETAPARLLLGGFVFLMVFAAGYMVLDAFGIWQRLPAALVEGLAVLAGLTLLAALAAHLVLATGKLPADTIQRRG